MILRLDSFLLTYPCPEWADEGGTVWSNPTLEFLLSVGFEVLPEENPEADVYNVLRNKIQMHLDETAMTREYDGILSLCSYATSTDPIFAAEGQAGVVFRDGCWAKGREIRDAVLTGQRSVPTTAELLAEMPLIGW